jgi:hypothetical protein
LTDIAVPKSLSAVRTGFRKSAILLEAPNPLPQEITHTKVIQTKIIRILLYMVEYLLILTFSGETLLSSFTELCSTQK